MKKMKKGFVGLLFVAMAVVLVACSSGPKGTYKGSTMGVEITLTLNGKNGTMKSESKIAKGFATLFATEDSSSSDTSTTEELTIDPKAKTMTSSNGTTYSYTEDEDKLTMTASGLSVELTKEK